MIHLTFLDLFAALWLLSLPFSALEWYKTIKQHHQSRRNRTHKTHKQ